MLDRLALSREGKRSRLRFTRGILLEENAAFPAVSIVGTNEFFPVRNLASKIDTEIKLNIKTFALFQSELPSIAISASLALRLALSISLRGRIGQPVENAKKTTAGILALAKVALWGILILLRDIVETEKIDRSSSRGGIEPFLTSNEVKIPLAMETTGFTAYFLDKIGLGSESIAEARFGLCNSNSNKDKTHKKSHIRLVVALPFQSK